MLNLHDVATLGAADARDRLARGELRAAEYADACLKRIETLDGNIGAWQFVDRDLVMKQAESADRLRKSGRPIGPLHGVPVGIKDIIDTRDMPTENGTVIDAGRRPRRDATVVARLRAAGAIIVGKTVCTELAYFAPAGTRNPHDPHRTPGGSSSGSAAAVAAGMVPLAIGTQTAGSVIRPASYCGVVGFKPGHGLIPRTGILTQAPPLDTVGTFSRSVEDAALICDVLAGHDPDDADTRMEAPPAMLELARSDPPLTPLLALIRSPAWDQAEESTRAAFEELQGELGRQCDRFDLPEPFAEAAAAHRALMRAGFARHLRGYHERYRDALSPVMRETIEDGQRVLATEYLSALDWREVLNAGLEKVFERYDAIITPATTGEAPVGLESTGSAAFNVLWSLLGVPVITLPLMEGPHGMPLGVQVVGRRGYDGRLLRTARWLMSRICGADAAAPAAGARS